MLTVDEAIRKRRSNRSFDGSPVSEEMIIQMLAAARLAPSGGNSQPWRFVVVTTPEEKKGLSELCFNQNSIKTAGVVFIACGDPSVYLPETMMKRYQEFIDTGALSKTAPIFKTTGESYAEPGAEEIITRTTANTFIAVEHIALMATALGLGSCLVGAISDEKAVKELFGIPDDIMLVLLVAVGHPNAEPTRQSRYTLDEILLRPFPNTKS